MRILREGLLVGDEKKLLKNKPQIRRSLYTLLFKKLYRVSGSSFQIFSRKKSNALSMLKLHTVVKFTFSSE
jgi:hypothetical protein